MNIVFSGSKRAANWQQDIIIHDITCVTSKSVFKILVFFFSHQGMSVGGRVKGSGVLLLLMFPSVLFILTGLLNDIICVSAIKSPKLHLQTNAHTFAKWKAGGEHRFIQPIQKIL